MKQRLSTIFLKIVIFFMGIAALVFCVFILPEFANRMTIIPEGAFLKYPFLICAFTTMIIFFFALYQAIKLLGYIDKSEVFSNPSIKTLKNMKISGIIMTLLLYLSSMPMAYLVAEAEDAPGLIIIGFAICSIPLVVAIFIAVLQRLLQEAIDIKSENDFTV